MSNRKNKLHRAQLIREQKNAHRQQFFSNVREFCQAINVPDILPFIPKPYLDSFYARRFYSPKIVLAEGVTGHKQLLEDINTSIVSALKKTDFQFKDNSRHISYLTLLVAGLSTITFVSRLSPADGKWAEKVLEIMHDFKLEGGSCNQIIDDLQVKFNIIGQMFSDLEHGLVVVRMKFSLSNISSCLELSLEINLIHPEKIHFKIDGENRPAWRVGWIKLDNDLKWATIKSEALGKKTLQKPLEVYMQAHAIQRFHERLNMFQGTMYYNLLTSFAAPVIIKNGKNCYLIEYQVDNHKVGYFLASKEKDKLLLRTFLFLTYTGTPEGKKLEELTGLQKMDKKYLALDSLSDFVMSDIFLDPLLKELFIKAGCASLMDLDDIKCMLVNQTEKNKKDLVLKYINLQHGQC